MPSCPPCADGEVDVRGCYCAMATAHMLELDAKALAQAASMVEYVRSCQASEATTVFPMMHATMSRLETRKLYMQVILDPAPCSRVLVGLNESGT